MNMLRSINGMRRLFMYGIVKNIAHSDLSQSIDLDDKIEIKSVLICRPNHRLGNQLLITPIVQEVLNVFPEAKIDLFLKGGLGHVIFKNYSNIGKIICLPRKPIEQPIQYVKSWLNIKKKKYDLVINVVKGSSSGRISTRFSNSKYKVFGNEADKLAYEDAIHIAKGSVYSFRHYLKELGFDLTDDNIPLLNIKLSPSEISEGQKMLKKLVGNDKKTICLFTYATDDKCHPESWWLPFYEKLQKTFPNYNVIEVLPVENVSQIQFKAPTLYSKDIREMAALIANTEVFIGADGGVMHLACAAQTPTVGLFSRANQKEYAPYGNNSLALNTNHVDIEGCINAVQDILTSK